MLTAFRRGDDALELTELARRTSLVKSTIMRLCISLEKFDLVERLDDGRYLPARRGSRPDRFRLPAVLCYGGTDRSSLGAPRQRARWKRRRFIYGVATSASACSGFGFTVIRCE